MSKKVYLILVLAVIISMTVAACERSATGIALPTPTALTSDPLAVGTGEDPMELLQAYATQTAMAQSALPTSETPAPGLTPGAATTDTTPLITPLVPPTGMPTVPASYATPTPGRPATHALQPGEYPYCIARRFNLNPEELLTLNGLTDGQLYIPGLQLTIPQTGNPFPGDRSLRTHPATYTVTSVEDTIYKVACYYGDVDPMTIAAYNGLAAPYRLTTGQILNIP
ncbi:MAG: LysM domain-containing protein [Chloroflexota bacterium]